MFFFDCRFAVLVGKNHGIHLPTGIKPSLGKGQLETPFPTTNRKNPPKEATMHVMEPLVPWRRTFGEGDSLRVKE